MDLSDEELAELHDLLENETLYGDDNIVYGSEGDLLRQILTKVELEGRRRRIWSH